MWMYAFEMGEHDVAVQGVMMLDTRVHDDVVCDRVPVLTGEVASTTRAGLRVRHVHGLRARMMADAACV